MDTIFDKHGMDLVEDSKLSGKEMKSLFLLLLKLDSESMVAALDWFSGDPEDLGDKYYMLAIQNFFAIQAGKVVAKHFGDEMSDACNETEYSDFAQLSFIKLMKTLAEELPKTIGSNIIVINNP
jgi:hypothetical protein